MNAEQLADQLTYSSHQWGFAWPLINDAAVMLRKQDAAIKKMKVALQLISTSEVTACSHEYNKGIAKAVLTATEEFK